MKHRAKRIWNRVKKGWEYKPEEYYHRVMAMVNPNKELKWKEFLHLKIRVLHALNHAEIARIYTSGQQNVLKEFGVKGVTSAKRNTWENPNTYLFLAEDAITGEIGAGMRLDVADMIYTLPLEDALKNIVPDLSKRIHKFDNTIAEACGWWVKKEFSERRIPKHLLVSAIAVAPKLRINVMLGFPHQITKKITDSLGFESVRNLGDNNASFYYPNEQYLSTVVELDTVTLKTMPEEEKSKVLLLRQNPIQTILVEVGGYKTRFDFDLRLL